jgi:hypothetical protein
MIGENILKINLGGIIALGLFKMNWSVERTRRKFMEFSKKAFAPRELLQVPIFKNVAQLFCSFRYKTDGIEKALQDAFGHGPLFGDSGNGDDQVKVGVVAAMRENHKPYLFSSYSRNPTKGEDHVHPIDIQRLMALFR